jgi:hypothetical protein
MKLLKSAAISLALLLAACNESESGPYLEYAGGGFIFNYRNAVAFYGFVARPLRTLPEGAVIEAQLEIPGTDKPFIVQEKARSGQLQYSFKSPEIKGVVKDHRYKVVMRVLDQNGKELARYEHSYKSDIDQSTMPEKPLVVGPGYQKNPELNEN